MKETKENTIIRLISVILTGIPVSTRVTPIEDMMDRMITKASVSKPPVILPRIMLSLNTGCVRSVFKESDTFSLTIASYPRASPKMGKNVPIV